MIPHPTQVVPLTSGGIWAQRQMPMEGRRWDETGDKEMPRDDDGGGQGNASRSQETERCQGATGRWWARPGAHTLTASDGSSPADGTCVEGLQPPEP